MALTTFLESKSLELVLLTTTSGVAPIMSVFHGSLETFLNNLGKSRALNSAKRSRIRVAERRIWLSAKP